MIANGPYLSPEVGAVHESSNARLLLVRHGRTAFNAANQLRGRLDPELDEVGGAEASALAAVLGRWEPVRVVSSPLRRALQTAEALAGRGGVRVSVDPGLIDRDYGKWAGHTTDEIVAQWGSVDRAPGVEPVERVLHRAAVVLMQQLRFLSSRPVVLVTHDAVIKALLAYLDPTLGPAHGIDQRTGCWNELVHEVGAWRVVSVDQRPVTARPVPGAR